MFTTRKFLIKLVWGRSAALMRNEFDAYGETAAAHSLWKGIGAFFRQAPTIHSKVFFCYSRRLLRYAEMREIDVFVQGLIDRIPEAAESKPWKETFNEERFAEFWTTISEAQRAHIDELLEGVRLPVTGAHGDFADRHFLIDALGDMRIIDWEYYNPNGSVVSDVLRLYGRRNALLNDGDHLDHLILDKFELPIRLGKNAFCGGDIPSLKALGMLGVIEFACKPMGSAANRTKKIIGRFVVD